MQDKQVIVFHGERFYPPGGMIENANMITYFQ